jgi:hypothetical protein
MNYLLVGGAQSVGKSESIYRLTHDYLIPRGFNVIAGNVPASFCDFEALIEGIDKYGNTIRIIINTATDTEDIIRNFKKFYDYNPSADILISSVRDDNFWPRKEFFSIMGVNPLAPNLIEVPLAKITRRGANHAIALNWYNQTIDKLLIQILNNPPFDV